MLCAFRSDDALIRPELQHVSPALKFPCVMLSIDNAMLKLKKASQDSMPAARKAQESSKLATMLTQASAAS